MGYYVKAYCTTNGKPTVQQLLDYLNDSDYGFDVSCDLSDEEAATDQWTTFELTYDEDRSPIIVEYNGIDDEDNLLKEEIPELLDEVESADGDDAVKQKVSAHLRATVFVIANELRASDMDDEGYSVNGELLKYFVDNYNGMIYADGEGFYEGEAVILEID